MRKAASPTNGQPSNAALLVTMVRWRMSSSSRSGSASAPFQGVIWNSRRKAGSVSASVPSSRIGKIGRRSASSCGAK